MYGTVPYQWYLVAQNVPQLGRLGTFFNIIRIHRFIKCFFGNLEKLELRILIFSRNSRGKSFSETNSANVSLFARMPQFFFAYGFAQTVEESS